MVEYMQSACSWIASWPWQVIWGEVKSSVFPLVAPSAAVYVAYKFGHIQADIGRRQAETAAQAMATNRDKLRLDLFDRRFAVYEAARRLINKAIRQTAILSKDDVHVFFDATEQADWLFDEKTARYLSDKVFQDAFDLATLLTDLADEQDQAEKQKLLVRKFDAVRRFTVHQGMLHTMMEPYLGFTDSH